MSEMLIIGGRSFELLGLQRGGAAVYRGEGEYLRIGETRAIERDLALHRAMEKARFPVPSILSDGEMQGKRYFVESSAGTHSFRAIFQEDVDAHRTIKDEHFDAFVAVMKKLHAAQKKNAKGKWSTQEFAEGIRLPELCKELPVHADAIRNRFDAAVKRLETLPRALTHGDCNPANIYERGVIDLEDSFYGPLGYDVASALVTIEWSPELRSYEFFAQYRFSEAQKAAYKKSFRSIAPHFEDFAFCRAAWLSTGMGAWPRIQQWRFEKFIHEFLS
jgi:Ser/Thr protein kinase RdoA (MazF antagonist)